jgi:hypothetical protein
MADKTQGTVVRGADGSLFFLRPEVMEATKVTEPEMVEHLNSLVDKRSGVDVAAIGKGGFAAESTIMCPGTINDVDVVTLPAASELNQ